MYDTQPCTPLHVASALALHPHSFTDGLTHTRTHSLTKLLTHLSSCSLQSILLVQPTEFAAYRYLQQGGGVDGSAGLPTEHAMVAAGVFTRWQTPDTQVRVSNSVSSNVSQQQGWKQG